MRITLVRGMLLGALGAGLLALASANSAADTPAGRYTIAGGVVTDNLTALKWQQTFAPTARSHGDASLYCAQLTLSGGNWRLPSQKELQTIIDDKKLSPAIDVAAFPSTPSARFWTSSAYPDSTVSAFTVDFQQGDVVPYDTPDLYNVRCVK